MGSDSSANGPSHLLDFFFKNHVDEPDQPGPSMRSSMRVPSATISITIQSQDQAQITPAPELRVRQADCQQISQSASQAVQQASQSASQSIQQASQSASQAAQQASQSASQAIQQASQTASQAIQQAQQSAAQSISAASRSAASAASSASSVVSSVQSSAASAINQASQSAQNAILSASAAQVRLNGGGSKHDVCGIARNSNRSAVRSLKSSRSSRRCGCSCNRYGLS